jgi:uncharacterized protein (TIGR04222 family)
MDNHLWNKIAAFDLDSPWSEYGFSVRLAKENYWTKNFTKRAILEYKKFMYLAATSELMVSPSEIIDVVWHQHIIFTKSYGELCDLLGKQIQHVPSTHNREDFEKFKLAKDRTRKMYSKEFGEQPEDLWDFPGMFHSLRLDKAKLNIRTFIIIGMCGLIPSTIASHFLLRPLLVKIGNPQFIIFYIVAIIIVFFLLWIYNRKYLSNMIDDVHRGSFLFDLQPLELVYLKTQDVDKVIDGTLNQLVIDGKLRVSDDNLEWVQSSVAQTPEQVQVLDALAATKKPSYRSLMNLLRSKPIFNMTKETLDAVKKYFIKSRKFGRMFHINFFVLCLVLLVGIARLSNGVLNYKPVGQLVPLLFMQVIAIAFFLNRLVKEVISQSVADYYKRIYSKVKKSVSSHEWAWDYAFYGTSVLTPSLILVAGHTDKSDSWSSGDSSSCGTSCSSCGGCGGD